MTFVKRNGQYLCLYGTDKNHVVNSPEKVYINHGKIGTLLNEITGIPYRGRVEVDYAPPWNPKGNC